MLMHRLVFSSVSLLCAVWTCATHAGEGSGLYSKDQVGNGRGQYAAKCGVCHGASLKGGGAPELIGAGFVAKWNGKTLNDLYVYIRDQMPKGSGNSLPNQDYVDITAFILAQNGLPAGTTQLKPD